MNILGGGLVVIIAYAGSVGGSIFQNDLLTEASDNILTESGIPIDVE